MTASIAKSRRPAPKARKRSAPSMTRDDLSFTARVANEAYPDFPSLVNWSPPEVPAQENQWNIERNLGLAMTGELAALANACEIEAFNAIAHAFTSNGWRPGAPGPECGFSEGVAALAILGLRHLARGGRPFDKENPKPAIYWTGKRILEKQMKKASSACAALWPLEDGRTQGMTMALFEAGLIGNEIYMKTFADLREIGSKRERAY